MKLATIVLGNKTQAVRVMGEATFLLPFVDVGELLNTVSNPQECEGLGSPGPSIDEADFAPVITRPSKIICVGLNYRTHLEEMGRPLPEYPTLFAKFAEALIGARDDIVMPVDSVSVDWEAELAVIVGKETRHADATEARAAIAGYTVANDVTMRDYQRRTTEWLQGKTFESTSPLGPVLVTPEEVGHAEDLAISCIVDGVLRQSARTADLLFSPSELVAYVSTIVTLRPGDVLLTGTPGGVGAGMEPPVYLQENQVLTTAIAGIGACVNTCVRSST